MSHNDLATQASTLGDRSHQKRELAAISVEMTVRQIMSNEHMGAGSSLHHVMSSMHGNVLNQNRSAAEIIYRRTDQIQKVINFLMTNYIDSEQANFRKGGLMGLAGVMIGLTNKRGTLTYEGNTFLNQVIPIIQKCLDDKDASVRYYAMETLFNVITVARYQIILFFDPIFSQIQILSDDEDELVRESNRCVNRLLQDVACNYDHFKVKSFIHVLQSLIRSRSVRVRILALDWMIALDAEPDIYFLVYLHHFLYALFALVVDARSTLHYMYNQRARRRRRRRKLPKDTQLTQKIMTDFLDEISEYLQRDALDIHPSEQFDINRIVVMLVKIIMSDNQQLQSMLTGGAANNNKNESETTKTSQTKTKQRSGTAEGYEDSDEDEEDDVYEEEEEVTANRQNQDDEDSGSELQFDAILDYKHPSNAQATASEDGEETTTGKAPRGRGKAKRGGEGAAALSIDTASTQKTVALKWLDTFITLGGTRLKKLYPSILQAILFAMNDERIQTAASHLNEHLMFLVLHLDEMDQIHQHQHHQQHQQHQRNQENLEHVALVDDIINELKQDDGVSISDEEADNGEEAEEQEAANGENLNEIEKKNKYDSFDIKSVMNILIFALEQKECAIHARIAALNWLSSLLMDLPFKHIPIEKLLKVCFMRLCDPVEIENVLDSEHERRLHEAVTSMTLEVLARLSLHPRIFEQLFTNLLQLFYNEPKVLQSKGKLIITKLCSLLDCTQIYSRLANLIILKTDLYDKEKDQLKRRRFVRNMVRLLNLILLTSAELYPLREIIKSPPKSDGDEDIHNAIFLTLYKTWCASPISLLSLCLLAQRYDLGLMLVNQFKKDLRIHKSVQFLLEIDELIHLLESPIFLQTRLQLLCMDGGTTSKWQQLFQIVNGLLTLLPNSDAFHQFRIRIHMVATYKLLFTKMASKANNPLLLHDELLNHAIHYRVHHGDDGDGDEEQQSKRKRRNTNNDALPYKLFQLYMDAQTKL